MMPADEDVLSFEVLRQHLRYKGRNLDLGADLQFPRGRERGDRFYRPRTLGRRRCGKDRRELRKGIAGQGCCPAPASFGQVRIARIVWLFGMPDNENCFRVRRHEPPGGLRIEFRQSLAAH
jgi:hypothetical protein